MIEANQSAIVREVIGVIKACIYIVVFLLVLGATLFHAAVG